MLAKMKAATTFFLGPSLSAGMLKSASNKVAPAPDSAAPPDLRHLELDGALGEHALDDEQHEQVGTA
jgi:hypothetical protein